MLEFVGFSKKPWSTWLLPDTLNLVSSVGSQLSWKSSSVSIVNFRYSSILFSVSSIPLLVISMLDSSWSSLSHLIQYLREPSSHLHPGFSGGIAVLPSSMYLLLSQIWTHSSLSIPSHFTSNICIRSLARAQVPLRPMGPPAFCLKFAPPKE